MISLPTPVSPRAGRGHRRYGGIFSFTEKVFSPAPSTKHSPCPPAKDAAQFILLQFVFTIFNRLHEEGRTQFCDEKAAAPQFKQGKFVFHGKTE